MALFSRSPAAGQRSRGSFSTAGDCKELDDLSVKRVRKPFKYRYSWIFQTSLKTAHVGAIDLGVYRQHLLRETATDPQTTEISRHQRTGFHARRRPSGSLLNHGL